MMIACDRDDDDDDIGDREHLLLTFCYKLKFEIANVLDMPKTR